MAEIVQYPLIVASRVNINRGHHLSLLNYEKYPK